MNLRRLLVVTVGLALCMPQLAAAQSAWLPLPGRTVATLSFAHKQFKKAWIQGSTEFDVTPGGHQNTVQLNLQRDLTSRIAIDVAVGGTSAQFAGMDHSAGVSDTELGLQAALLTHVSERGGVASTVSARVAGVFPGTYSYRQIGSAGAQAGGVLGQLLGAVDASAWHVGIEGSAGYQKRFSHRPDRWQGALGAYARLTPEITVSTTYRYLASLTGPDLFGNGFTLDDFTLAHEVQHNLEGAFSLHVAKSADVTFFGARRVLGKNTEQALIGGVGITRTY